MIYIGSLLERGFMEQDGGIQAVKAARNQALCREVNERIESVTDTAGDLELQRPAF